MLLGLETKICFRGVCDSFPLHGCGPEILSMFVFCSSGDDIINNNDITMVTSDVIFKVVFLLVVSL